MEPAQVTDTQPSTEEEVRTGQSLIHGKGLFSNRRFKEWACIGKLQIGAESSQSVSTISVNGRHYIVEEPWVFLNHSCGANGKLQWFEEGVFLVAGREIQPEEEITIDYRELPERVKSCFECHCEKCRHAPKAQRTKFGNNP